jgi:glutamate racemase
VEILKNKLFMIGFFDSGLGGLTVLKEVIKLLPQYSYIYLGDNARTPYGGRSQEVIYQFTIEGIKELFKRGAELVILACNTSSSVLRRIQREFLPKNFPNKRVLGIIIPTAEEAGKFGSSKNIGILATEATVNSLVYPKEINKIYPEIKVYQQACPLLVPIIEAGEIKWRGLDLIVQKYLKELFKKSKKIDTVVLGCTHYPIIKNKIEKYLPSNVRVISQGKIVAEKLKDYLKRHPELKKKLSKNRKRIFLTTESSKRIKKLAKLFYDQPIKLDKISSLGC